MSERKYAALQDVVEDARFPELDLALRRGRHIDRDDLALYTLLVDAQDLLEAFYKRFGAELVHRSDGYFYLLPTGEQLSRRQLSAGDMLVGQALALMYLDPATIERGGRATLEDVVAQLVVVLGSDALIAAFNPKRKRYDERIAQKTVRAKVAEGLRHLAALGFIELDGTNVRLRPALLRFAEPVRNAAAPAEALAALVAKGEVELVPDEPAAPGPSGAAEDEVGEAGDEEETPEADPEEDDW